MPAGEPPKPVQLTYPDLRKLDNGLRVAVFTDHSSPAVNISLNLLTGAANDPVQMAGLAFVTANVVRRGTARHTGDELAEIVDSHGMSLSEYVEHYESAVRIWTLSEHTDLACRTLAEVVREPVFPEREVINFVERSVAREKSRTRTPRRSRCGHWTARFSASTRCRDRPAARRSRSRHQQGADRGIPQAVLRAGRGDAGLLRRHHRGTSRCPGPGVFRELERTGRQRNDTSSPQSDGTRVLLVDRPDASQSEIRIGQVVPFRERTRIMPPHDC